MVEFYENSNGKGKTIIILDKKEGTLLVDAVVFSSVNQRKKRKLKELCEKIKDHLACY